MAALESRAYVYMGDMGEQVPRDVTHLRVDASVTIIPYAAFRGLKHLVEVELPEGLLEIGDKAYYGCGSLSQINFPSTLRKIGDEAFSCPSYSSEHYGKLVDITLPEGLIQIGDSFSDQKSLKRINIPSSVRSIEMSAFYGCAELEHVELCEGLEEISRRAFNFCSLLKRINIPSTVRIIRAEAFAGCRSLEQIVLPHGLECIDESTFSSCTSLQRVEIPSTVRSIKDCAFKGCYEMTGANIPDSVERIGHNIFSNTGLANIRLPPLLGTVQWSMIDYDHAFSIELPKTLRSLKGLPECPKNLRNIAIPKNCRLDRLFDGRRKDFDLRQAFPLLSRQGIELALVKRFEGLPIHKLCYFQSCKSTAVVLKEFNRLSNHARRLRSGSGTNATGNQQDCLGMTPLHILACSVRPNLELCRVLIDRYPKSLIAKDKWGDMPLLYALWSNASPEMVQLMVGNSFKSLLPGQSLDWTKMVVTLSKGCASLKCMNNLLELQKTFCNSRLVLREVITELVESESCRYRTMKLLLEYDIEARVGSLNVGRWGQRINQMLETYFKRTYDFVKKSDAENVSAVYSALTHYEQLKDAMALLELALWKAKLEECTSQVGESAEGCERKAKKAKVDSSVAREQCRITCGADIIVPNVWSYL